MPSQEGLAKAEKLRERQASDRAAEEASAAAGDRPALSLLPPGDPAELLEAAEQLCHLHPSRETLKVSRLEVCFPLPERSALKSLGLQIKYSSRCEIFND